MLLLTRTSNTGDRVGTTDISAIIALQTCQNNFNSVQSIKEHTALYQILIERTNNNKYYQSQGHHFSYPPLSTTVYPKLMVIVSGHRSNRSGLTGDSFRWCLGTAARSMVASKAPLKIFTKQQTIYDSVALLPTPVPLNHP